MPAPPSSEAPGVFDIKDCALIAIATGRSAWTIKELTDILATIDARAIYYHFWAGHLATRFREREFNNDFASWARHGLHDSVLAERLAVADPSDFATIDDLRASLLDRAHDRLEEREALYHLRAARPFVFIKAQLVVFDTRLRIHEPRELGDHIARMPISALFYHIIDARWRNLSNRDDLSQWLASRGAEYDGLRRRMAAIDPQFLTLTELRDRLASTWRDFFKEHDA